MTSRRRPKSYPETISEITDHVDRDRLRRELYRLTLAIMHTDPECRRHLTKRCQDHPDQGCVCSGASFAFDIALRTVAYHLEVAYDHPTAPDD